jgi:hypothetical protein
VRGVSPALERRVARRPSGLRRGAELPGKRVGGPTWRVSAGAVSMGWLSRRPTRSG